MITPTSNQKNVLKEYLEKGTPQLSVCIEIITLYCTSFPTRFPYPLFKETHRVFWELPPGKVGKNGKIVKQSGQKGNTCIFYATKRLLRYEQTKTPHHTLCSQRRKAITAADNATALMRYHEARNPANETFLNNNDLEPVKASRNCWIDHLKLTMPEVPPHILTRDFLETMMRESIPKIEPKKPWYRFELIEMATEQTAANGYGLQTIPCSDLLTANGLAKALLKGPLMIKGHFGSAFYFGKQPMKLAEKKGAYHLYGWGKNTPFSGSIGLIHAIVLIGIEIKPRNTRVYWIDPNDPSDPNQPETQRVFIHPLETIVARMTCIAGTALALLSDKAKQQVPGALYNPQFTTV